MTIAMCAPGAAGPTLGAYFSGPTRSTVSNLVRSAPFAGAADSSRFILSGWFKSDQSETSNQVNFTFAGISVYIALRGGDTSEHFIIWANATNPDYGTRLDFVNSHGGIEGEFHHFAMSIDTGIGLSSFHFMMNGVELTTPGDIYNYNAGVIPFGGAGIPTVNGYQIKVSLAELYFAPGQYLDLSIPANLAKFLDGKKPVNLGSNGSAPTGTAPILYLSGAGNAFARNRGTGGDMAVAGASLVPSSMVALS